jgi:hypothetical protein
LISFASSGFSSAGNTADAIAAALIWIYSDCYNYNCYSIVIYGLKPEEATFFEFCWKYSKCIFKHSAFMGNRGSFYRYNSEHQRVNLNVSLKARVKVNSSIFRVYKDWLNSVLVFLRALLMLGTIFLTYYHDSQHNGKVIGIDISRT